MKQIKYKSLFIVLIIQSILILWNFLPFFTEGENIIFCLDGDGLKNYYTIYAYFLQEKGIFASFQNMNYPFSEYIFFTDNSPSFAVPLKWFSDNIFDLSPYAFRLYNWFLLFGILLSTLFTWLIINKLTKSIAIWSVLAITLPWVSPQVYRLIMGHFNLSFSWVFLLVFYLLIRIYESKNEFKKVGIFSAFLVVSVYIISFIHLYYLPMVLVIIGMFGLVIAIWERKNRKRLFIWLGFTFLLPIISFLSVFLTIRGIDKYYHLRKATEMKFGWWEWNLKIDALYSDHYYSTIPFLFRTRLALDWEGYAYLGAFGLYAFTFFIVFLLVKMIKNPKQILPNFKSYFSNEQGRKVLLILFAGLMCLNIALGEYVKMFNGTINLDNPLHPFLYAKLFVAEVTQFRVLARFNWVFFWSFQFILIYLLDNFYTQKKGIWLPIFIGILLLFSISDMYDVQRTVRRNVIDNPLKNDILNKDLDRLLKDIDTKKYQAILPIPIYMIGSENDEMMLMPEDNWRTETWLFSIKSNLPLMATNLSRSAVIQHESLLSIFTKKGINDYLLDAIDDRPILVFYSNNPTAWSMKYENEQATEYRDFGKFVPEKYNMKLLKSEGDWAIYEWEVE
ncbi:MAG: hypothetical protein ACJA1N_000538 [Saprospiraceae bacterium]|jgi:hypothetical protein